MAVLLIKPVHTVTKGDLSAKITGIEPTSDDCLVGEIYTKDNGVLSVNWNMSGICRDNQDICNLVTHKIEIIEILDLCVLLTKKG